MNYIRNRHNYIQYLESNSPSEQLYDGTWEDTFIGRFFSFVGKQFKSKIKKGKLNKLLSQLENLLTTAKVSTIESLSKVSEYELYQYIAIIKSYLYNEEYSSDKFEELLEEAINFHEDKSKNDDNLDSDVISKHREFSKKFNELKDYKDKIEKKLVKESLEQEDDNIQALTGLNEILLQVPNKPFDGTTNTLLSANIGTEKRYEELKKPLFDITQRLRKLISDVNLKNIENDKIAKRAKDLYNYLGSSGTTQRGSMNWDNLQQLRKNLRHVQDEIKGLLENIDSEFDVIENEKSKEDSKIKVDTIDSPQRGESEVANLIIEKANELFPDDNVYRDKMNLSEQDIKQINEEIKKRIEEQTKFVDPISILRIFNRANDVYTITKEEYELFNKRYSKRVAARKAKEYEVIGDTARHKKLFNEWNDNVLSLIQTYGEHLNKNTKEFIISYLDNNKLYGNKGEQFKLLAKHFDIKYDKKKFINKAGGDIQDKVSDTEEDVEEYNSKFTAVKRLPFSEDMIDVPIIFNGLIEDTNEDVSIIIKPSDGSFKGELNILRVKYNKSGDIGFIENYMEGTDMNVDKGIVEHLIKSRDDETFVYVGNVSSRDNFFEKGDSYNFTGIKLVKDLNEESDFKFKVNDIFVLTDMGDNIKKLPLPNSEIMKAVEESDYDNFETK